MIVADASSRAYIPGTTADDQDSETHVHMIVASLPVSADKLQNIRKETAEDETLQTLRQVVHAGWPERRSQIPRNIQDYWNYRRQITVMMESSSRETESLYHKH